MENIKRSKQYISGYIRSVIFGAMVLFFRYFKILILFVVAFMFYCFDLT